jgi:hypothetical protein
MRSVPEIATAFWVVVCAGIAMAWAALIATRIRRAIPRRRHARAIARYASAHGWDHQAADRVETGFGDPFEPGEEPWCTNVIRGALDGRRFTVFEYDVREQVFMIDLPESLPFLEVRPRTLVEDVGLGHPSVEVESIDFNDRWQVLADSSKYALAILHPVLMSELLAGPEAAWRIYEQRMVAWRPGILDPAQIVPALELLRRIETSIPAYVWEDYAERDVTPNPNDVLPY